jgi:hypothetical protein
MYQMLTRLLNNLIFFILLRITYSLTKTQELKKVVSALNLLMIFSF